MEGKLIVLEGMDGSGKATQAKLLKEALEKEGHKVLSLSYPDYLHDYGKMLEAFLHSKRPMTTEEQFFLYLLDMLKDKENVEKALASGSYVILDRYFLSTVAYQCSNGFDIERAKRAVDVMGLRKPSVIFYVGIPIDQAMARKYKQKESSGGVDKFEKDKALLERVSRMYKKMMDEKLFCDSWVDIDGSLSQEEVSAQIVGYLHEHAGDGR